MTERARFGGRSPGCLEFQQAIWQHYGALFSEYGFDIAEQRDSAGEHCMLILESPDCRFRFIFDRGSAEVHAGRKHARALWTERTEASQEWFAISTVLDYLAGRPKPNLKDIMAQSREALALTSEERMAQTAARVRAAAKEIIRLFGQDLPPDEWQAFLAYYADNQDLARELAEKFGRPSGKGTS